MARSQRPSSRRGGVRSRNCERSWPPYGRGVKDLKMSKRCAGRASEVAMATSAPEAGTLLDWLANQLPVDGGQDLAPPVPQLGVGVSGLQNRHRDARPGFVGGELAEQPLQRSSRQPQYLLNHADPRAARGMLGTLPLPDHGVADRDRLAEVTDGEPGGLPRLLERFGELLELGLARHRVSSPVKTSSAACLMSAPSVEETQPVGKAHASSGSTSLDVWQGGCLQSCTALSYLEPRGRSR